MKLTLHVPHFDRLLIARYGFLFLSLLIIYRLFSLQIVNHEKYKVLAARQHVLKREVIAERGKIYSSDGAALATTQDGYLLFVVPKEISDKEMLAQKFMELIPFKHGVCLLREAPDSDYNKEKKCELKTEEWEKAKEKKEDELKTLFADEERLWVPIIRGLTSAERDVIKDAKLEGVHFEPEKMRVYPEGSLAAHILGFVGSDEFGHPTGYFGLEGYYNGELTGIHGSITSEIDASGKPIPIGVFDPTAPKPGMDLTLTIRRELQYMLDNLLIEGVEKYDADYGSYILMDPRTGEILAMGNAPTYEPSVWGEYLSGETDVSKVDVFKNHAISDNYEPGSVMKALTVSAGLDSGAIPVDYTYQDDGAVTIQGNRIDTWNSKHHGQISVGDILELSNNPGAAAIGLQTGATNLWAYLEKFGLGRQSGIDLQGEESGLVKPIETWREIDTATASFGQGISVTPLQLVSAMAAIANDGVRMKPFVVKELSDPSAGEKIVFQPKMVETVVDQSIAQHVRSLLQGVVDEGEFRWFIEQQGLADYPIAGKTGTAQIPIPGGYDLNKTNVTFVGFSPVDEPKFVLLVRLHKPKTSTYSAETAVPLWLSMSKELITYFGIAPR